MQKTVAAALVIVLTCSGVALGAPATQPEARAREGMARARKRIAALGEKWAVLKEFPVEQPEFRDGRGEIDFAVNATEFDKAKTPHAVDPAKPFVRITARVDKPVQGPSQPVWTGRTYRFGGEAWDAYILAWSDDAKLPEMIRAVFDEEMARASDTPPTSGPGGPPPGIPAGAPGAGAQKYLEPIYGLCVVGQPVMLRLRPDVVVKDQQAMEEFARACTIQVVEADARPATPTKRLADGKAEACFGGGWFVRFDAAKLLDLSKPGTYRLRVWPPPRNGDWQSADTEVTIVSKDFLTVWIRRTKNNELEWRGAIPLQLALEPKEHMEGLSDVSLALTIDEASQGGGDGAAKGPMHVRGYLGEPAMNAELGKIQAMDPGNRRYTTDLAKTTWLVPTAIGVHQAEFWAIVDSELPAGKVNAVRLTAELHGQWRGKDFAIPSEPLTLQIPPSMPAKTAVPAAATQP